MARRAAYVDRGHAIRNSGSLRERLDEQDQGGFFAWQYDRWSIYAVSRFLQVMRGVHASTWNIFAPHDPLKFTKSHD